MTSFEAEIRELPLFVGESFLSSSERSVSSLVVLGIGNGCVAYNTYIPKLGGMLKVGRYV